MTIHKEGYTPIALCILFIFVLNALIQFYLPQAHSLKWFVYILSFLAFVFIVLFFCSSKEGKPVIPANIRAVFLSAGSVFKGRQRD